MTSPLKLNVAQLHAVESHTPVYQLAQSVTGVPWQAVAAIHFRENNLSATNPHTIGGPFQFDPPLSSAELVALFSRFTTLTDESINEYAQKGINDFQTAAIACACWLREKTKAVLSRISPDDVIKDAIWGYNGRSFGSADHSSYVMNGYDSVHMDMHIVGSIPNPHGGRIQINEVDHRPGAFTVYSQLKGLPA